MASGIGQVRLYRNTINTIPGTYEDVTSSFNVGQSANQTVTLAKTWLTPGTEYWYWVQLIDVAGNDSGIRPLGSVTTTPDTTAPTIFSAAASLANNRDVSMTWSTGDSIVVASVYVYITTDSAAITAATIMAHGVTQGGATTAYSFANQAWGTTYNGWVCAKDAAANNVSAATRFTPNSITTAAPDITTGLVKQNNSCWKFTGSGTLDASEHTVSVWVKLLETPTVFGRVLNFEGGASHFNMLISTTSAAVTLQDNGGNSLGLGTALANLGWHHIAFSRKYSTNTLKVSIDGVGSSYTIASQPPQPFNVDLSKFNIGSYNNGSNRQSWCAVGEVWFAPRYMDVSSPGVISKFYSAGKPVSLGTTGLLVDGTAPYLYLSGSSFANFGSGLPLQHVKDASALSYAATPLPETWFYAQSAPTTLLETPLALSEYYDTEGYNLAISGLTIVCKVQFASSGPNFILGRRTSKQPLFGQ